jgi:serine/threonine protein kinase
MTRETTEERTQERWRRTLDIFEQSLSLPPDKRNEFLRSACAGDLFLQQTVKELVDSHEQAETEDFMESPAWSYSPPDSTPQLMIGRQVGSYRLTQFIDQGGMGVVYLAEPADGFFRRQAAVKLIRADLDPKQYRRFRREVQILADLKHPNLVFLYEAGRMADGRPYLAMEYVEGENLRDWQRRQGVMPLAMIVEVMKQAGAGLSAAHEAGIIHRDIKPGNIIVSEGGGQLLVKVLDFGIAARKETDSSDGSSTQGVIGTVLYMSPEQLQGKRRDELTPASDVYSLGLTVYELLTGRPAINGDSQAEIVTKHLHVMPDPPSRIRPDLNIPATIDRVVMKALAKDPNERYQSAPEFGADLEAAHREGLVTVAQDPSLRHSWDDSTEKLSPPMPIPAPAPLNGKGRNYARPLLVFAAAIAVSFGTYLLWQQWPSVPPNEPVLPKASPTSQTTQVSTPVAPTQGKTFQEDGLEFVLNIESGQRSYSGCRFALFKPEVSVLPSQASEENALVIFEEISRKYPSKTASRKVIIKEKVKPGEYFIRFDCPGYKIVEGRRLVQKSSKQPELATLTVELNPR